jgi:serine/threonine protein kinase
MASSAELQRIGRYTLIRPLSKGGMALVYEGRRESLAGVSPRVAVKLILPQHASSETFKELFINEARLGASMQHQNLVQIQDFDAEGETYYLVMEYVEGFTLRRLMTVAEKAGIRIPLSVVAEIGRQVCDGLDYAHKAVDEQGRPLHLVHRDMKPSNLILTPHGIVKVLDFGISKGRLREERKGSVKGTWGYMAPEQAAGLDVGPTTDVFGLAVVLYELASLRPMFSQETPKDEMRRLLKDDRAARVAATLDAEYSPLVGALVRALQRDPSARYDSAAAFGRALSALLPDPVTARDDLGRFFEEISRLDAGPKAAREAPAPATPSPEPTRVSTTSGVRWSSAVTFVAAAGLSFALLLAAVIGSLVGLGEAVPRARVAEAGAILDEPSGPAGVGAPGERRRERRPPSSRRVPGGIDPREVVEAVAPATPEPIEPVTIAIIRPGAPPAPAPAPVVPVEPPPPPPPAEPGLLSIGATQAAEVWVDGKYLAPSPARREIPSGVHEVTLVAADGRRKTFRVTVDPTKPVRKVWDFDRMEWR